MRIRSLLLVVTLLCLTGAARAAFEVMPTTLIFKANMNETMVWVDVLHKGGGPIAIEMEVLERYLTIDGDPDLTRTERNRSFTVHPARVILQPDEQARVQVVYRGPKVSSDKAYVFLSREIPLTIDGAEGEFATAINTLVQYYSVLAFETGKRGRLTFISSKAIEGGKIEVIVENRSQGRVPMDEMILTVGKDKIKNFTGKKNSVMPGQQRRLTFEYARPVTARDITFGYK